MYQINETVAYGANGACKVIDIANRKFNGTEKQYYILQPVNEDYSMIYVPVDNPTLTEKMRRMLSAEEIDRIICSLPHEDSLWIEDENVRKERFHKVIAGGDCLELAKLVKGLYLHQAEQREKGRKLHQSDERFFKEAEKILYREFAQVLGIEPEQVVPYIQSKLGEGTNSSTETLA